ncbi:hypothetical protein RGF97_21900 [Streptomyces roseicoloratus]|uniref:Uncharacterized protein n=1 Tax=Streptomyces roseicoloratus TaxID=2508722 RepID=A0ABY9RY40_9ACTN|nr:hypothetical protein [Streptomyces roseicoloratus]WMX46940.1 hypothetical protein RGF97_21900 [Streptomyces roseicoloratus]
MRDPVAALLLALAAVSTGLHAGFPRIFRTGVMPAWPASRTRSS